MTKPILRVKAWSQPDKAEVLHLPVTPIINEDLPPELLLQEARAADLIKVVICGIDARGIFSVWSSTVSNADALMLNERARHMIVQSERDGGWRPETGGEVLPFRREP